MDEINKQLDRDSKKIEKMYNDFNKKFPNKMTLTRWLGLIMGKSLNTILQDVGGLMKSDQISKLIGSISQRIPATIDKTKEILAQRKEELSEEKPKVEIVDEEKED